MSYLKRGGWLFALWNREAIYLRVGRKRIIYSVNWDVYNERMKGRA